MTGVSILTKNCQSWTYRTVLKRLRNILVPRKNRQRDREHIETCNVTVVIVFVFVFVVVVVVILLLRVVLNSALNAAAKDKRNEDE